MFGGIKDRRWKENPNACVECGEEKPLNKSNVCEDCFTESATYEAGEDWEEE